MDLELNKKLALAIGWREDQIVVIRDRIFIKGMLLFDHADWQVAGPIAQRYNLLVDFRHNIAQFNLKCYRADTPQRAIALAVIGAGK